MENQLLPSNIVVLMLYISLTMEIFRDISWLNLFYMGPYPQYTFSVYNGLKREVRVLSLVVRRLLVV